MDPSGEMMVFPGKSRKVPGGFFVEGITNVCEPGPDISPYRGNICGIPGKTPGGISGRVLEGPGENPGEIFGKYLGLAHIQ